jgi:hypothetical protein
MISLEGSVRLLRKVPAEPLLSKDFGGSRAGLSAASVENLVGNLGCVKTVAGSGSCCSECVDDGSVHSSVRVAFPIPLISCHIPARMSPACHDGIITADMNRENASIMTNTGSTRSCPDPPGCEAWGTTGQ